MNELSKVTQVKEKYESWLLSIEGVVGVGVGKSATGKPCIKVYTREGGAQVQQFLPSELDGIEVEPRLVGELRAY